MKSCSSTTSKKEADFLPCCCIAEPDIQKNNLFHVKKRSTDFFLFFISTLFET